MTHRHRRTGSMILALFVACGPIRSGTTGEPGPVAEPDRSPIALARSTDGSRLLVANQTSGSVSLVDPAAGRVIREATTGDRPSGVAISKDGRVGVVAHWYGYDLAVLDLAGDRLAVEGRIAVGPEPRGVAIAGDNRTAYVAVGAANEVVRVDLIDHKVTGRIAVGREPRAVALTPDGSRLVVANNRSRSVSVIALPGFEVERTLTHEGDNLRQLAIDGTGKYAYVAAMGNRGFATSPTNIDLGWVLGQRVVRLALDGSEAAEVLSLDPKGDAAGDAHGLAIDPTANLLAVACGGTHEVLLIREGKKPLPWREGVGRDLMAAELVGDRARFRRIAVGGRPTELAMSPDGASIYVANYLENAIQVIDVASSTLARSIPLGGPAEPSLARRGEVLFHDAKRSSNNWYSCNTCHSDGHTNGLDFDTSNDGWQDLSSTHLRSRKKVPTLRRVAETAPWTWHGWQKSLDDSIVESFTKSMQGKRPSKDEVQALNAYLGTLDFPPNPHREADGSLSASAVRGEALFRSGKSGCASCHGGPEFTDGKVHQVGLNERGDVYKGHNPPSLRGVYDKDPYLHDGRSKTLRDAITGVHSPESLVGGDSLTEAEVDDLVAYLKSL